MSAPYFADDTITLFGGDCLDVLPLLPDASVDAVVTDPPAGVSFMGREWDSDRGGRDAWIAWLGERMSEAYRVLKPGGHALVWALPRTSHWTAMALEDAGFEIRDCVVHLFGSGFPKSLDVSKAIDKAAGAERQITGTHSGGSAGSAGGVLNMNGRDVMNGSARDVRTVDITAPATDDARRWQGWGTALKPGQEIWWLVRKPLAGTVAGNVLEHGTGALNIDGCRIAGNVPATIQGQSQNAGSIYGADQRTLREFKPNEAGRWPTNIVLTHSAACDIRYEGVDPDDWRIEDPCAPDCPVAELDRQSGVLKSGVFAPHHADNGKASGTYGAMKGRTPSRTFGGDSGGASRYFPVFRYSAKAPASERPRGEDGTAHPTVKPVALMSWLVRLVCPPGGTVLDPFLGSGTTAEACLIEGFRCIGIERDEAHLPLIKARLSKPIQPTLGFEAAS